MRKRAPVGTCARRATHSIPPTPSGRCTISRSGRAARPRPAPVPRGDCPDQTAAADAPGISTENERHGTSHPSPAAPMRGPLAAIPIGMGRSPRASSGDRTASTTTATSPERFTEGRACAAAQHEADEADGALRASGFSTPRRRGTDRRTTDGPPELEPPPTSMTPLIPACRRCTGGAPRDFLLDRAAAKEHHVEARAYGTARASPRRPPCNSSLTRLSPMKST
jgi:hypothetical protein